LETKVAVIFSQAELLIHYCDSVVFPLRDSTNGTNGDAARLGTVATGKGKKGHGYARILPLFYGRYPSPIHWPHLYVMPVLTSYAAGMANSTSSLIVIESQLHSSLLR